MRSKPLFDLDDYIKMWYYCFTNKRAEGDGQSKDVPVPVSNGLNFIRITVRLLSPVGKILLRWKPLFVFLPIERRNREHQIS